MTERSVPLPKFGQWDVNNPASAGDFSVIFDRASNAKRAGQQGHGRALPDPKEERESVPILKKRQPLLKSPSNTKQWFCCARPRVADF
ncbi:RPM1-interacting protein 4 (RIN4) family protein [Actinidia rufa]|uniref:RPM1-interacting protein 4 (RIN4) family protein n=1 Tax=Actinidia rufa TaxID=165716 RepID=A0A7J0EJ79_9ERIC|nr:RPM1-interacting protein 4 (RIN4) family protein [Actinidia rufa]